MQKDLTEVKNFQKVLGGYYFVKHPLQASAHIVIGSEKAIRGPAQSPPRCTKCNSPPINGHTDFILLDVAL